MGGESSNTSTSSLESSYWPASSQVPGSITVINWVEVFPLAKMDQLAICGVEWESQGIRSMRTPWIERKVVVGASVKRVINIMAMFTAHSLHCSDLCRTWFWSVSINS